MRPSKIMLLVFTVLTSGCAWSDTYFGLSPSPLLSFPASPLQVPYNQNYYEDVIISNNTPNNKPAQVNINLAYMDSRISVIEPFEPLATEPTACSHLKDMTLQQKGDTCTVRISLPTSSSPTTLPADAGHGFLAVCNDPTVSASCSILLTPTVTIGPASPTTLSVNPVVLIPGVATSITVKNTGTVPATHVIGALPAVFNTFITSQSNECDTIPAGGTCQMSYTLAQNAPIISDPNPETMVFQADNTGEMNVNVTTAFFKVTVSPSLSFSQPGVQNIEVSNAGNVTVTGLSISALDAQVHNITPGGGSANLCTDTLTAGSSCYYYFTAASNAYVSQGKKLEASALSVYYNSMQGVQQTVSVPVVVAQSTLAFNPASIVGEASGSFSVNNQGAFDWVTPSVTTKDTSWLTLTPDAKGCPDPVLAGQACTMDYTMTAPYGLSSVITATGANTNVQTADLNTDHFFVMGAEKASAYQHYQYAAIYVKNLTNVALTLTSLSADIAAASPLANQVINCDQTGANCDASVIGTDQCAAAQLLAANTGVCHIWYKVLTSAPSGSGAVPVNVVGTPTGAPGKTLTNNFTLSFTNSLLAGGQSNGKNQNDSNGFLDIWNGTAWQPLGTAADFDGVVHALALYKGNLIVGGNFDAVAAVPKTNLIASFDGSAWHDVGQGLINNDSGSLSTVNALYSDDSTNTLYVGGHFTDAAAASTLGNVAAWDGSQWTPLSTGLPHGDVNALTMYGDQLIAGGNFYSTSPQIKALAYLDAQLKTWQPIVLNPNMSINQTVYALAANPGSPLYIGGEFPAKISQGVIADNLVQWDGKAITALNGTTTGSASSPVESLALSNNNLYIGGGNFHIGSDLFGSVAMYDGAFHALGDATSSPQGQVNAIALDPVNLFVGQAISTTGQSYAMQWDGTKWASIGDTGSLPGDVKAQMLLPQLSISDPTQQH